MGQSATINGYTFTYRGLHGGVENGITVITTRFTVKPGSGQAYDINPGERIFPGFENQPTSIVSITTHGVQDLYVFLSNYDGTSQASTASIKIFINPLVPLVWTGGVLMLLGGIVCWWPERRRRSAAHVLEGAPARTTRPVEVAV
ncbi:MAG: cytochrome c-type biogenesis CcmF C-terminal domain-containing protein, partial [Ktedonobacterales bacterium]